MPVALQIFAKAAKDAGISTEGTTKELFKLMEGGLVPAAKIMPFVSKRFSEFANKNGALEKILAKLGKRMDIAKDSLKGFQEQAFEGGVEEGLGRLLDTFNMLMKNSRVLASVVGGAVNGILFAITTPFKVILALVEDIMSIFSWLTGVKLGGELAADIIQFTTQIIVATAALRGMWALMKLMAGFSLFGALIPAVTVAGLGAASLMLGQIAAAVAGIYAVAKAVGAILDKFGYTGDTISEGMIWAGNLLGVDSAEQIVATRKMMEGNGSVKQVPKPIQQPTAYTPNIGQNIPAYVYGSSGIGGNQKVHITLDSPMLHAEIREGANAAISETNNVGQ